LTPLSTGISVVVMCCLLDVMGGLRCVLEEPGDESGGAGPRIDLDVAVVNGFACLLAS
jgi:hypothetical protein